MSRLGPTSVAASNPKAGKRTVWVGSSLWAGGALPRQTHCVLRSQVRQFPRSGLCASSGGTAGSSGGDAASQGLGLSQARAPTPSAGPSLRKAAGPGLAHPLKNRGLGSLCAPQTQNDRLPLRAPTSQSGRVQGHYPHYKWGSIAPRDSKRWSLCSRP